MYMSLQDYQISMKPQAHFIIIILSLNHFHQKMVQEDASFETYKSVKSNKSNTFTSPYGLRLPRDT